MKKTKEERKKTRRKIFGIIGIVCLVLIILHLVFTGITNLRLRHYINSFAPVEYDSQLIPEKGSEGYMTFTSDGDFEIMQLNDLHIGGGIPTYKADCKTIYEVMTMVQKEKPDLVILNGDSIFAVPNIGFNGGQTFNNKMVSKVVKKTFDRLGVYYTIAFGNHDTESFDFTNRKNLGKLYANGKSKYCIFETDYDGYGVTNQCILLKSTDGSIRKAIMVIDSNDYVDNSLSASINWKYDTIHDEQVIWARDTLLSVSENKNKPVKSLFFFHIPVGEFVTAYRELEANNFRKTADSEYISGFWDEVIDADMGERIWYGGCCQTDKDPEDVDILFETLGPDGINSLEGIFCGHDHVNNGTVKYKGVYLAYGNSLDNIAYDNIRYFGIQRGSMVITVKKNNKISIDHRNAYTYYGADSSRFYEVNVNDMYYPDSVPGNPK